MLDRTVEMSAEQICDKLHRLRIEIEAVCYDVIQLGPGADKDARVNDLQREEGVEYARLSATPSRSQRELSRKADELCRLVVESADGDWSDGRLESLAKSVADDARRLAADEYNTVK